MNPIIKLPVVAFDEAGNTGQNLLDLDQPVFVAASVLLTTEEARDILGSVVSGGAAEAKFSKLRRNTRGKAKLIELFDHPLIGETRIKLSVYHKRFMVTTKIVDLLVEPLLHRSGIDLYEGGQNLGLANLWHHVIGVFCGQKNFDELLLFFVEMVRNKTAATVSQFYRHVDHLRTANKEPGFDSDLTLILATEAIVDQLVPEADPVAIDPAIPAFVDLAAQWSASLNSPFRIVHDRSKPVEHEKEMLETLMSYSETGRVFENVGPAWRLPLLSDGIDFVDSHEVAQVQLADLVAGAAMMALDGKARGKDDEFTKALAETNFGQLSYSAVWPILAVTPDALHATERAASSTLDFVVEVTRRGRRGKNR